MVANSRAAERSLGPDSDDEEVVQVRMSSMSCSRSKEKWRDVSVSRSCKRMAISTLPRNVVVVYGLIDYCNHTED